MKTCRNASKTNPGFVIYSLVGTFGFMARKIVLFYFLLAVLGFTQACISGGCDDPQTVYFKWKEFNAGGGCVTYGQYGFTWKPGEDRVDTPGIYIEMLSRQEVSLLQSKDQGIFSIASASKDCIGEDWVAVHYPVRIAVHTLREYSPLYPANSNVTDLFSETYFDTISWKNDAKPLNPLISISEKARNDIFYKVLFLSDSLPAIDSFVQFRVTIYMNDSSSLSKDTEPVRIR